MRWARSSRWSRQSRSAARVRSSRDSPISPSTPAEHHQSLTDIHLPSSSLPCSALYIRVLRDLQRRSSSRKVSAARIRPAQIQRKEWGPGTEGVRRSRRGAAAGGRQVEGWGRRRVSDTADKKRAARKEHRDVATERECREETKPHWSHCLMTIVWGGNMLSLFFELRSTFLKTCTDEFRVLVISHHLYCVASLQ